MTQKTNATIRGILTALYTLKFTRDPLINRSFLCKNPRILQGDFKIALSVKCSFHFTTIVTFDILYVSRRQLDHVEVILVRITAGVWIPTEMMEATEYTSVCVQRNGEVKTVTSKVSFTINDPIISFFVQFIHPSYHFKMSYGNFKIVLKSFFIHHKITKYFMNSDGQQFHKYQRNTQLRYLSPHVYIYFK